MKPIRSYQLALTLLILYCVGMSAGCPVKTTPEKIRAAVDASYRLPATTNDLIKQIGDAQTQGLLSVEKRQEFGRILQKVAAAEVVFVASVKALDATYTATGQFDPTKLKDLKTYFDASIVDPFLSILSAAGLLSGTAAQGIQLAAAAVRLLLSTIGSGFGSRRLLKLASITGL